MLAQMKALRQSRHERDKAVRSLQKYVRRSRAAKEVDKRARAKLAAERASLSAPEPRAPSALELARMRDAPKPLNALEPTPSIRKGVSFGGAESGEGVGRSGVGPAELRAAYREASARITAAAIDAGVMGFVAEQQAADFESVALAAWHRLRVRTLRGHTQRPGLQPSLDMVLLAKGEGEGDVLALLQVCSRSVAALCPVWNGL